MKLFKKPINVMNNTLSLALFMFVIIPLFSAFREPVVKEKEMNASSGLISSSAVANEKYIIYIKESVMTWKCSMAFANKGGHNGYISIKKGELIMDKGQLVGGVVEVDMNTIADEKHGRDNDLVDHLKSADFFDAEKFPVTTFAIAKVVPATGGSLNVTGKLTIKGITHEVTFPVTVDVKNGIVNANGKVTIDRTQWDVRYKSGKFFGDLADEAISDDIEFDMKIVAKK